MHPLQIVFILICLTLLAYGVLWCAEQIGRQVRRQVFSAARPARYVENEGTPAPVVASSPQTDALRQQTDAPPPRFEREQLLTLYAAMRAHGFSREAARAALRGIVPLDNNLWAEAAPKPVVPDDADIVTPYAGRRTKAAYYPEEPELEYQAP